jgi:hypothetical protein
MVMALKIHISQTHRSEVRRRVIKGPIHIRTVPHNSNGIGKEILVVLVTN